MLWKTAEGEELYYEVSGYGPPLLLIHGLGGSGRDWGLQLPALRQHFRTITIDLRGHGRSSRPACGYTIPGFAVDTADFMTSLGFFPAQVMGISLGGMVALQMRVIFRGGACLVIVNRLRNSSAAAGGNAGSWAAPPADPSVRHGENGKVLAGVFSRKRGRNRCGGDSKSAGRPTTRASICKP